MIEVDGKFLQLNGERLWIKGVTYGSFSPNEEGEPFPSLQQVKYDFSRMRDAGINTVRLYSPPSNRIADAAADVGLLLVPDICWGIRRCQLDDPSDSENLRFMQNWVKEHSQRLAGHPAILMYSIGNEIPPLIVRWYGRERIEQFIHSLYEIVKTQSPNALVTYANHPPTEYLNLSFLDVISYNVYLEREDDFRKYLARLQNLASDRPLFLSELGLDSNRNGEDEQAEFLDWSLRAVFEKGLCGAAVYSWTDEWGIFETDIEGWSFGLTDVQRRPKPSLERVSQIYASNHYNLRRKPWPSVSVVVASYNGGVTLDRCLKSLSRLNYPDYEVTVIDDASTDNTSEIAQQHQVRCIQLKENGGLSNARNLGIQAATGDIVAFIDSDAYADPDWLYFMVTALEEQEAGAVGGPNLSPPEDEFVAQCVTYAPGNPTHVLIDDQTAEHVAGCNIAFRKEALKAIGQFDTTYRAAGDDVDVCWKLMLRDETIAFSPAAIVWHHRRPTIGSFLRQQKGYGHAEALLQRHYPSRFNFLGHFVWRGEIYEDLYKNRFSQNLPFFFSPRIYHGRFGSGMFQSLYQPFPGWWFQIFTTIEWQMLSACVLASGLLGRLMAPVASFALLVLSALMIGITLGIAGISGYHAIGTQRWREKKRRWLGFLLISWLHIAQPLARAAGRIGGWRKKAKTIRDFPAEGQVYGNMEQRDSWLERIQHHLGVCGWVCRESSDWDNTDFEVLGPGPYILKFLSTCEENLEHQQFYLRYRITARLKPQAMLLAGVLLLTIPVFVFKPFLLPMVLSIGVLLYHLFSAKHRMVSAVSHLAKACAEAFFESV